MTSSNICLIIAGAGRSSRFRGGIGKVYVKIGGKPVFLWAVDRFRDFGEIRQRLLVVRPEELEKVGKQWGAELSKRNVQLIGGGKMLDGSNLPFVLRPLPEPFTLNSVASGNWDAATTWDHGTAVPELWRDIVVHDDEVTVTAGSAAWSLSISHADGKTLVGGGNTLAVGGNVQVDAGTLDVGGTLIVPTVEVAAGAAWQQDAAVETPADDAAADEAETVEVTIAIKGLPSGARATFDGKPVVTPFKVAKSKKTGVLRVTAPGHFPFKAKVERDRDRTFTVKMRKRGSKPSKGEKKPAGWKPNPFD